MLFYFPHIISKREAHLIKPLWLLVRIDRTWNPYEIEVGYCVKGRELSMTPLKKPYFRIKTIGRDNPFVKIWECPYISRLSPPETTRIHGVVAWWPSITAISIVSFIQNIHGNLPLIKDEIFQHLSPSLYLLLKRTKERVVRSKRLVRDALWMEVIEETILLFRQLLNKL